MTIIAKIGGIIRGVGRFSLYNSIEVLKLESVSYVTHSLAITSEFLDH
jgi:hypothetical protein